MDRASACTVGDVAQPAINAIGGVFFAEKRAVNFDGTNTNTSRPSVEADGKRPSFLLPPYLLDPVALSLRICCSKKKKKKGGGEAVKPV